MTYEYLCTSCGYQWEAEQPISANPLRDCPKCKKATAKRQVSGGTGFLLKGGGWYADGYGSSSGSKSLESSAEKSSGASTTSDSAGSSGASSDKSGSTSSATATSEGSAKPSPSTSSGSNKKPKADKAAKS